MQLPVLNFPKIMCRFKQNEKGDLLVFDIIRKKFVVVTPEEWVRQHVIHYLIDQKKVPVTMISVEKQLLLNNTKRRTDIVVFNSVLKPVLIIECKAPSVSLDQSVINQALRYNLELKVPFIVLSNGLNHISLQLKENNTLVLNQIPDYKEMIAGSKL